MILYIFGDKQFDGIAKGTIHVECFNGKEWKKSKLSNVYYAPEMGNFNLFSWGQALESGCGLSSEKDQTYIYNTKTKSLFHCLRQECLEHHAYRKFGF